ncbi:phosphatase PAP2 family protein [Mesorhizobium sp. INR15]|uniref:phosphatase PAP2 family protein n=1 Tax=Mesorhizobium sp. INR15 TaxID=2654248 RepID=UPI0018965733|nr:phosphatase PAP2 family protein [Mesorhizobium sp. INR15]QPC95788.1 phosphatase PAP2 family protein [Mesorhizobium sp. INR15]
MTSLRESGLLPIVAVFLAGSLILGFGFLAEEVLEGDTTGFDMAVVMALRSGGNPADPIGPAWVEEMGRDVTALGSFAFLGFVFVATVGYLLLMRQRALALLMSVAVLGGVIISTALKMGFDRPRPDIPHAARVFTASFPSGHATLSTITFLTLGALLTRVNTQPRIKTYFVALTVFLTVMVGLSRIYLGVHYPTDVLAGWCVGAAWAILCWVGALWLQGLGNIEQPHVPPPSSADHKPRKV